jgi:hypothetical protein
MAEQQHPVRRKVALKILKPGMDIKEVIARFESERQALAFPIDQERLTTVPQSVSWTDGARPVLDDSSCFGCCRGSASQEVSAAR